MIEAKTQIATKKGPLYIKRLCKHFAHKVPSEFSGHEGLTKFSIGDCHMQSDDHSLTFIVTADSEENLEQVKEVVISHLNKFARDEQLTATWDNLI